MSCGATTMTGTASSMTAIGPCIISPAAIAFGVHVGDFLQLQRAFERDWLGSTTAEIGTSRASASSAAVFWTARHVPAHLGELSGKPGLLRRVGAAGRRQHDPEGGEHVELGREGLGRATPILGPPRVGTTASDSRSDGAFRLMSAAMSLCLVAICSSTKISAVPMNERGDIPGQLMVPENKINISSFNGQFTQKCGARRRRTSKSLGERRGITRCDDGAGVGQCRRARCRTAPRR